MKFPDVAPRSPRRQEARASEIVLHEAAKFIQQEAGPDSLITALRAESLSHGDHILIFVSVFPIEKARQALVFLERQREAFSNHLKKHAHLRIPRVDFMLDNRTEPEKVEQSK